MSTPKVSEVTSHGHPVGAHFHPPTVAPARDQRTLVIASLLVRG
jgi:hypothetical protein